MQYFVTLRSSFRHSASEESIHEGHANKFWLYCKKTWVNALKVKSEANEGPLHQSLRKASYAPVFVLKYNDEKRILKPSGFYYFGGVFQSVTYFRGRRFRDV